MTLAERLRAALALPAAVAPLEGDLPELRAKADIAAAVLIAVTDRPRPGVILTVRREHMRTHAGQVAFPGGRIDPGEDAIAAALREAREEILLDPASGRPCWNDRAVPDGHRLCRDSSSRRHSARLALEPHEHEVADWFEAPLDFILDPAKQEREAPCSRAASVTITRSAGTIAGFGGRPQP